MSSTYPSWAASLLERGKMRQRLVLVGSVLVVTGLARPAPAWFTAALFVLLPGCLLHFVAKCYLHQNREVTRTGPYRWVRNPFYLANALIDLAICLAINCWQLTLAYAVLWTYVMLKTIRQEEGVLEGLFGDDFRAYKARVPCLFPWRRPLPARPGAWFSLNNENIAHGGELSRVIRYLGYPLLFYTLAELHRQGWRYLSTRNGIVCAALILGVLLRSHGAREVLQRG